MIPLGINRPHLWVRHLTRRWGHEADVLTEEPRLVCVIHNTEDRYLCCVVHNTDIGDAGAVWGEEGWGLLIPSGINMEGSEGMLRAGGIFREG